MFVSVVITYTVINASTGRNIHAITFSFSSSFPSPDNIFRYKYPKLIPISSRNPDACHVFITSRNGMNTTPVTRFPIIASIIAAQYIIF